MTAMHGSLHDKLVERSNKYKASLRNFEKWQVVETNDPSRVDLVVYYKSGNVVTKTITRYNIGYLTPNKNGVFKLSKTPDFDKCFEKDDFESQTFLDELRNMFISVGLPNILLSEFTFVKTTDGNLIMKSKANSLCYYSQAIIEF